MGWKELNYAKRGGIISLLLGLIVLSPLLAPPGIFPDSGFINFIWTLLLYPFIIILSVINFLLSLPFCPKVGSLFGNWPVCGSPTKEIIMTVSVICSAIIFFLIGAGIGKIVEKIKSKN